MADDKKQIEQLTAELTKVKGDLTKKDEEFKKVQATLKKEQNETKKLKKSHDEQIAKIKEKEQQLKALNDELTKLKENKSNLEKSLKDQTDKSTQHQKDIEQKNKQIGEYQKEQGLQKKEIEQLSAIKVSLNDQLSTCKQDLEKLTATFEKQQKQIELLNKEKTNLINDREQYQSTHPKNLYFEPMIDENDQVFDDNDGNDKIIDNSKYIKVFDNHSNIITGWNVNTQKTTNYAQYIQNSCITTITDDDVNKPDPNYNSISKDDKDNKDDDIKEKENINIDGTKLYNKTVECHKIIEEQMKRLKLTLTDDHVRELINYRKEIAEQLKDHKNKSIENAAEYENWTKQYKDIKQQILNMTSQIYTNINDRNQITSEGNDLLTQIQQKDLSIKKLNQQKKELQQYLEKCKLLITEYNKFMKINKLNIKLLKQHFAQKWDEFESKWYTKWDENDILHWMKYKTMNNINVNDVKWDTIVLNELKDRQMNGKSLQYVDRQTLDMIKIKNFKVATDLMCDIKNLREKYKFKANPSKYFLNSDQIPSKFICPLTKKIMKEPVMCDLDEVIYEREAITQYLKEHKKSPTTGEYADDDDVQLFDDDQLQTEIQLYQSQFVPTDQAPPTDQIAQEGIVVNDQTPVI